MFGPLAFLGLVTAVSLPIIRQFDFSGTTTFIVLLVAIATIWLLAALLLNAKNILDYLRRKD